SLARPLDFEQGPRLNPLLDLFLSKPAGLVRTTAVERNPAFALAGNPLLDVPTLLGHSGSLYGPQRLPVFVNELRKALPDAFSGLMENKISGAGMQELMRVGGLPLGRFGGTKQEVRELARMVRAGGGYVIDWKSPHVARDLAKFVWDVTPRVGERMEAVPRIAAMRLAERYGG